MSKNKTPMEQQYDSIKENHKDKILLFRLGDFYEIFNDDATIASSILNIAMTKRHNRPMCGFPHHALDQYSHKLVNAGHKVAICEQIEDVSEAKGIVKRDVVSVLTKGTWSENPLLDRSVNSFLAIIVYEDHELTILFADISTGDIIIRVSQNQNPISFLIDELVRYLPVETLCSQDFFDHFALAEELKTYQEILRILPREYFSENTLYYSYIEKYRSYYDQSSLSQQIALQGLFKYLEENHISESGIKHLQAPFEYQDSDTLLMNEDTLRHLELVSNSKDFSAKGTLFSVLNQTKTMPAARKLRRMLVAPSAQIVEIQRQQERTAYFFSMKGNCSNIQDILKGMSDLERLTARLITGKILPRECLALAETIQKAEKLKIFLESSQPFKNYIAMLSPLDELVEKIYKTVNPECSNNIDGFVIQKDVDENLDSFKILLTEGKHYLIKLQAEERIKTGITTLKVSYNKIYGYYIEIGKSAVKNIPEYYVRKQSLVNAERYSIPELDAFESKINTAEASVIRLEKEIYDLFIIELQNFYQKLVAWAEFVTEIDLRSSLAIVAKNLRYIKPVITENFEWDIQQGRHPVIEYLFKKEPFVVNDTHFHKNQAKILIVTGPNMAGKSTYLRQNALFAVMSQIGSYIPAEKATIGIVDQIFTRIGAADDLGRGRSTFFVEMQEAAYIIQKMTPKSLVIMDELGRGTSTLDGLSLAWAILEHLLLDPKKQGKIIFSTHYHELTNLGSFNGVKNLCMSVKENEGKPIFLRKVIDGKASKSYGIHVAEMAGMNSFVIRRAKEILKELEKGTFLQSSKIEKNNHLFVYQDSNDEIKDQIFEIISSIDANQLTPIESLNIIFKLKSII